MTLSDKIRQVGFTLAVGSIGFGAGYITFTKGGIADIIEEHQKESALELEAQQAYEAERQANEKRYIQIHFRAPQLDSGIYLNGLGLSGAM